MSVLVPINLDRKSSLTAVKVKNERPNRVLTPEFRACELPVAQLLPEEPLGICERSAESAPPDYNRFLSWYHPPGSLTLTLSRPGGRGDYPISMIISPVGAIVRRSPGKMRVVEAYSQITAGPATS